MGTNDTFKEIKEWIKVIVISLILAFFINNVVIVNAEIPSGSMENSIITDDRVIAFRLSYLFSKPQRYDIVIFPFPDNEEELFVKRVIGLPGEKVEIIDGKVYINDDENPLKDFFIKEDEFDSAGPFYVPTNSYFMLGDNRNWSIDSRFWQNKFVDEEKILGKVILRYFPNPKIYSSVK